MSYAICPNNKDHKKFSVSAHVSQEWKVNSEGEFIEVITTNDVIYAPDQNDYWLCWECGAEAKVFANKELAE